MINARLSKDRKHILCGRPLPGGHTCGERLASLNWWPGYEDGEPHIVSATLPSGFVLDEARQVWRLCNHARKRWERDRAAAAQGDRAAAERLRTRQSLRSRRARLRDLPWWFELTLMANSKPDLAAKHDAAVQDAREAERQARAAGVDLAPVFRDSPLILLTKTTGEAVAEARRRGFEPARLDIRRDDLPSDELVRRDAWPAQRGRSIVCPACQAINRLAAIADPAGFVR